LHLRVRCHDDLRAIGPIAQFMGGSPCIVEILDLLLDLRATGAAAVLDHDAAMLEIVDLDLVLNRVLVNAPRGGRTCIVVVWSRSWWNRVIRYMRGIAGDMLLTLAGEKLARRRSQRAVPDEYSQRDDRNHGPADHE